MGAKVTGVDAAPENIAAARDHAAGQGLPIAYFAGELAALPPATFDLVTSMEVVEHVADPAAFIGELAARLAPGGLMILSTPRSEEHTSELQSLMRNSYAVFCLKKKKIQTKLSRQRKKHKQKKNIIQQKTQP